MNLPEQSSKPKALRFLFSCLHRHGFVGIFFLLLVLVIRFKSLVLIESHYIGGAERDAGLYIWLTNVALKALSTDHWFTTNAFFPYSGSLAWSDSFILPAIFVQIACAFGAPHQLAYNILILGANLLNGLLTYLFISKFSTSRLATATSGAACIILSYFSSNLGHPQLQFAFFIPLTSLLALRGFKSPSLFSGFLVTTSLGAAFLTTVYYAVFCGLITFLLLLLHCLSETNKKELLNLWPFLTGMALTTIPLSPFILPYLNVQSTFGSRHFYEAYEFGAISLSYLTQSPNSLLYHFTSNWSHSEAWLFPGFLISLLFLSQSIQCLTSYRRSLFIGSLIVFTLVSLLPTGVAVSPLICCLCSLLLWLHPILFFHQFRIQNDDSKIALLGFGVFFAGLSFGSLTAADNYWWDFSPFSTLFRFMPGMGGIRVSARLALVALMIACSSLCFLIEKVSKSSRQWCLSLIFITIVGLENWVTIYPLETIPTAPDAVKHLQLINPPNSAAIVLPLTTSINSVGRVSSWSDFAFKNVNAMNWFSNSEVKIVNGYSGIRSDIIENYPRKLSGFPDARSLTTLGLLPNLDYLVVLPQFTSHRTAEGLKAALVAYSDQISLVHEGNDGSLLLKYSPITQNITKESFLLRIPAQQKGTLELALRFVSDDAASDAEESATIDVIEVSLSGREEKLGELTIPKKNKWVQRTIHIMAKTPSVAPHFLRFLPHGFVKVDVGQRRWSHDK